MRDDQAPRTGLYARVSSEQQAKESTIGSQVAALQQRINEDGLSCDKELCFVDDGYSGGTLVRPALEQLRDLAAAGGLERLYVHSPDRLARKYAYQVLLVDELRRCGVELIFLNRKIGTSPEEDLLLQVQGMVAEYERAKIMEKSRRGKRHAARCGRVNVLSGAPYGYRYIAKHEGDGEANYQIVLEEARVVRRIFEWVAVDRLSIGEVCRRLKREGTQSPRGKSYWDRTTIWGTLKNPAYKGAAAFGKTKIGQMRHRLRPQRGRAEQPRRAHSIYDVPCEDWITIPVPAIISEDMFDEVAEQLEENRARNRQRNRGARHLLQGLLKCSRCGYAFYGKPISLSSGKGKRRDYAYYRCIGMDAYRFGGQRICDNKQVRTDTLEAAVWDDVCSLLREPERVQREHQRRLSKRKKPGKARTVDSLEDSMKRVQRGIARLIDVYEDNLIDREEFEPRLKRAKNRMTKLENESKALAQRETQEQDLQLVIGRLAEFAEKVKDGLDQTDWMARREIIRALVKRVEIDDESVRVVYRVSPSSGPDDPNGKVLQHCRRRDTSPLWRSLFHSCSFPILHHTSVEPLLDMTQHTLVRYPVLDKFHQPAVVHGIKITTYVCIEHPVHFLLHDPDIDRIQRIVWIAPWSKAIRKSEEVVIIDRVQYLDYRTLDNLVFQCSHAKRCPSH